MASGRLIDLSEVRQGNPVLWQGRMSHHSGQILQSLRGCLWRRIQKKRTKRALTPRFRSLCAARDLGCIQCCKLYYDQECVRRSSRRIQQREGDFTRTLKDRFSFQRWGWRETLFLPFPARLSSEFCALGCSFFLTCHSFHNRI